MVLNHIPILFVALLEQRLSTMEESIDQMKAMFEKTLRESKNEIYMYYMQLLH